MDLGSIIMLIIAGISAAVGATLGHSRGKSAGKKEGVAQANEDMAANQSKKAASVAKERIHADSNASSADDDELDRRLSRHNRPN